MAGESGAQAARDWKDKGEMVRAYNESQANWQLTEGELHTALVTASYELKLQR